MTGLPLNKIYIDTRLKTNDSASNSDFRFQLNKTVFLPKDSTFCIDDVNMPHTWNTIETGVNDRLYVGWQLGGGQPSYKIIIIPPGRYNGTTLADWFRSEINAQGLGQWTVVWNKTNTITFATNNVLLFQIYTDDDLSTLPTGAFTGMDPYNKMTCNEILQIYGKSTSIYGVGNPFATGF